VVGTSALKPVRPSLEKIRPGKPVFSRNMSKRLEGTNVKQERTNMRLALQVIEDIKRFKSDNGL